LFKNLIHPSQYCYGEWKLKIKNFSLLCLGLAVGFLSHPAFAQTPPTVLPAENTNIGGSGGACIGLADMIRSGNIHLSNIPCFVKYFTQTLIGIAGTVSVVMVMVGGFKYIVFSDEKKAEAKSTIVHALIGLAIALMAWIVVDLAVRFATE